MDAASAIVVFIFFFSIISTAFQGGDHNTSTQEIVRLAGIDLPSPVFAAGSTAAETAIFSFVARYNRRLTVEEQQKITSSIVRAAQEYDVNPRLVAALIARESSFNRMAVSPTGALGLGQLLPSTAESLNVSDAFDVDQNVIGTTRYVKMQLDRWAGESEQVALALASYFQGYNAVKRLGGYYVKTQAYIQDIIRLANSI